MKKHGYTIAIIVLSIILAFVTFYMLFVHVPFYNYHNNLMKIRNEICETNHYEYLDYFYEHKGKQVYYILKVKVNGVESYVSYDQKLNLIDTYQGNITDKEIVKKSILDKYKDEINNEDLDDLEIAYENNKFVYSAKVQKENAILYIYYDLDDGEFLKAYHLSKRE